MNKPTLLVVDDHEHILKQLKWALSEDFQVHTAVSQAEAVEALRQIRPSLMTVDLALAPGVQNRHAGFEVLRAALREDPMVKTIVITSDQEEATAMQALRVGAFDYFVKPLPLDALRAALKRAAYLADLERRSSSSADDPGNDSGIIGESPAVVALRQRDRLHRAHSG
jgi:two-component system NtrC family response regulator